MLKEFIDLYQGIFYQEVDKMGNVLIFFLLILAGIVLLGIWKFLNTKYIREGIKDSKYKASLVVAGTFLSAALFLGVAWAVFYSQGYIQAPLAGFWLAILITGFLNTGMNMCRFYAYGSADLTLVSPIDALPPAFMVLSAWVILGEMPNLLGFIGILVIVGGVYALNIKGQWNLKGFWTPFANIWNNKGTRLALLAAAFPVISIVYDKKAVLASDPVTTGFVVCLIIGFSALFYTLSQTKGQIIKAISFPLVGKFLIAGLLYALILVAFNIAITMEIVPYVGALKRLSILIDTFLAYFFLKQTTDFKKRYMCAAIIVIGTILIGISIVIF